MLKLAFYKLFVLLPLIACFIADGQSVFYLDIEKGLSNNSVNCIYKDSRGFMWFGTYDGLNRYDGNSISIFRGKAGDSSTLPNNSISSVAEDINNDLWISSPGGIRIYHPATGLFSIPVCSKDDDIHTTAFSFYVNVMIADSKKNMLIGTNKNGLIVFAPGSKNGMVIPLQLGSKKVFNYNVNHLTTDKKRGINWLFVENVGLCKYDERLRKVMIVNKSISQVNSIILHHDSLWIGTSTGIFRYNPGDNTSTPERQIGVTKLRSLLIDKNEILWIATDGNGILLLDLKTNRLSPLTGSNGEAIVNSLSVSAMFEDAEGRKWIATVRGGVNIIDDRVNPFVTYTYNGPRAANTGFNSISSFCEDADGSVWLGTTGWGLRHWNRKTNSYTFYTKDGGNERSIRSNLITNIIRDTQNTIWVSTWYGGINRFDRTTGNFKRYQCYNPFTRKEENQTWFLFRDKQNTLWTGTTNEGTLYYLNREKDRFEIFDKEIINPQCMAEDKAGNLWAGTYNELIKIDKVHKRHTIYKPGHTVRSIHEDKLGNLWIGTQGGGLLLLNKADGSFTRYNENNGLQAAAILRIEEDTQDNLWMSSFTGLIKFNTITRQAVQFSKSDGLQSNQFSTNGSLTLRSGELMFGGFNGFHLFYPDSVKVNASNPGVFLTRVQVNGLPLSTKNAYIKTADSGQITAITVPYDEAFFTLDFAVPEYNAPDKIQYSYFMDGWDKGFNKTPAARSAVYSHINEGTYYFKVKTTDVWGVWGKETLLLKIVVLPPWYRSWWAYLLYFTVGFTLIWGYLHYKKNQEKLKYKIQLADLHVKKEEELNEKKLAFFTNVAHEFRTPLTLIINPVKDLLKTNTDTAAYQDISIVYRNAKRLMSLVNQLLLFRKAENETADLQVEELNFAALCKDVFECFTQQAVSNNKQYELRCDDDNILLFADKEKLEVCLFNLISNAMKYTAANGKILVTIRQTAQAVLLTVEDDGPGIPAAVGANLFEKFYQVQGYGVKPKKGFGIGLYLVKKFLEMHHGTIGYTTSIGNGTIFNIQLPKGNAHLQRYTIIEKSDKENSFLEELTDAPVPDIAIPAAAYEEYAVVTDKLVMVIIDDNDEIRDYMVKIFGNEFKIHQAVTGDGGLVMIRQYQPDIVISDIRMPGMNGIELCRQVKTDDDLKHTPFILLTGSVGEEVKLQGIECGADDYINKPFEKEMLVARVNAILQNRSNLQQYFFNEITHRQQTLKISKDDKAFIDECILIVEKNISNEAFNIKTFASEIGMSHSNLYKRIKNLSGHSINAFIRFVRLRKAADLLINSPANVNEIAFQVGMYDVKYFRQHFFKLFGLNPSDYIKKYRKPLSTSKYRFNDDNRS